MANSFISAYIDKCLKYKPQKGHTLFFRGENEEHTELLPFIYQPGHHYIENEDTIYKESLSNFPTEFPKSNFTVENLILMQHFYIPTRLLDISKTPLVALFFACYPATRPETLKKKGRVYVFSIPDTEIKYYDSDTVSILANLCKRPYPFSMANTQEEKHELNYLTYEIQQERSQFSNDMDKDTLNSVICLYPRMNNPRIIRQGGGFLIFGINGTKAKCADFAKIHPNWIIDKIEISDSVKADSLKDLESLNAGEFFFFPDYQHLFNMFEKKYR
jgi:hypothetical protein